MDYIVFDMEFNQDFASSIEVYRRRHEYPPEIIQIGAIKINSDLNTVETFDRYISPTMYSNISPIITELTGITTEQLIGEESISRSFKGLY